MQKIRVITIGKLKNKSLQNEIEDLKKRIPRFEILELKEIKDKNENIIKKKETEILKPYINENSYHSFLMWEYGNEFSTKDFSNKIKKINQPIQFLITGAFGPSEELKQLTKNSHLSLSKMTFTHEQALYMLVEQIYRHYCFEKGINYTK